MSLCATFSTATINPSPAGSLESGLSELPRNWFAAYTTPRHEKMVARHLAGRHIESFLPLYTSVRRWKNGCRLPVDKPLFPGYIFVNIPRKESVKVLQVPGVVAIVGAGREPLPLPDAEIESLRSALPLLRVEPHPYLVVGEKVRITSGSLAGMIGVLIRKKNDLRVVLTLDLIQQSVAVEIDADQIESLKQ
ncbi:MAG: UpxY family transcription antiterminator [Candidatus Korobacteraceae bacterium]